MTVLRSVARVASLRCPRRAQSLAARSLARARAYAAAYAARSDWRRLKPFEIVQAVHVPLLAVQACEASGPLRAALAWATTSARSVGRVGVLAATSPPRARALKALANGHGGSWPDKCN